MRNLILLFCFSPISLSAQWQEENSGVFDDLFAVDFIDVSTGYCGGANGRLLKTTDGGANWTATTVGDGYVSDLYFLDADHGYIQVGSTVLTTTNGTDFATPQVILDGIPPSDSLDYQPLYSNFTFNGSIGLLTCNYGTIPQSGPWLTIRWKTLDFGNTWEPIATLPNAGSFAFLNAQHWFAASFYLFETFDGGQTWDSSTTNYFSFPPYCRDCFQVLDTNGRGLISMAYEMDFARIPSFTDTIEYVPEMHLITDIDVQATMTRFLKADWVNNEMLVLTSMDQGQTLLPGADTLIGAQAMHFVSDNLGWACGDDGKIWKYTLGGAGIGDHDRTLGMVSVAPNPSNGQLRITDVVGWMPLRYTVRDAVGRVVLEKPYAEAMDVSDLEAGSYLLTVSNTVQRQSARFIKQ